MSIMVTRPTTPAQQHVERPLAPMSALRGHAREHERAGCGLVQPFLKCPAQGAPGLGERIAPSLSGNDEDAPVAMPGGPGQERSHLAPSFSACESMQVQPTVDRNSAAT